MPYQHSALSFRHKELGEWYLKRRTSKGAKSFLEMADKKYQSLFQNQEFFCDPDHPVKFIYKNRNMTLLFFFTKL